MDWPSSPARSNRTFPAGLSPSSPRAGFRKAQPMGTGADAKGPQLSGWPRQVSWDEFSPRSSRPAGTDEDAQISVQMNGAELKVVRENGRFRLGEGELPIILVSAQTWVIKGKQSAELLNHEQGHFDIAGLCNRDIVKKLQKLRTRSTSRLASEAKRIMEEGDRRADTLSKAYDSTAETDHGKNKKRQKAWDDAIAESKASGKPLKRPS